MYLHWDGRRSYRTRMPAPRMLSPIKSRSYGDPNGNRVVEGDNQQVMVSLRSQYQGMVDVAYLDPPYNTGKRDFAYSDARFHDPNADADDSVYVNNEDGGRHTKWLNYMGSRLWLTWQLLAEHGVCFVSINDIEMFRLGMLMDEIFGEQNRIGTIIWKQGTDNNPTRMRSSTSTSFAMRRTLSMCRRFGRVKVRRRNGCSLNSRSSGDNNRITSSYKRNGKPY